MDTLQELKLLQQMYIALEDNTSLDASKIATNLGTTSLQIMVKIDEFQQKASSKEAIRQLALKIQQQRIKELKRAPIKDDNHMDIDTPTPTDQATVLVAPVAQLPAEIKPVIPVNPFDEPPRSESPKQNAIGAKPVDKPIKQEPEAVVNPAVKDIKTADSTAKTNKQVKQVVKEQSPEPRKSKSPKISPEQHKATSVKDSPKANQSEAKAVLKKADQDEKKRVTTEKAKSSPIKEVIDLKESKKVPTSPNDPEAKERRNWKKLIFMIHDEIFNHKHGHIFQYPVVLADVEYTDLVKVPLDLSLIRQQIKDGTIKTTVEYQHKIILMCMNCKMTNPKDSMVYGYADEFLEYAQERILQFLSQSGL